MDSRERSLYPQAAGAAAAVTGILVLLGWAMDIPALKSVLPGLVAMKANTALCLLACGAALILAARPGAPAAAGSARILPLFALSVGGLTLAEYALGIDIGIDQLLFREPAGAVWTSHPGRMAPTTALNFVLIGAALLAALRGPQSAWLVQSLALGAAFPSALALTGYLYGAEAFEGLGLHTRMAAHTAAAFLALSLGMLFLAPDRGAMRYLTHESPGCRTMRRLIAAVVLILPAAGYLRIAGEREGLFGSEFGAALMVMVSLAALIGILWFNARLLFEEERERLALQEERESLSRFYSLSVDLFCVAGFDGTFKSLNPGWDTALGYSQEELLGRPFINFVHPEDREATLAAASRLAEGGPVVEFENRYLCKDGSARRFMWNAKSLPAKGLIYAVARDVTERKAAEERLRLTVAQLEGQTRAVDQFLIVAETDAMGRITYANDQFCRIAKYSREELLGRDHREVVNSGYHSKEFWREMWETIGRGRVWRGDIRNRAKDGTVYWVDTTIVPFLGPDGKPQKYLAIRAVITERKAAEERILGLNRDLEGRNVELAAVNKELEAFSYSTAHDLRSPLRAISGFAQVLLEDHGPRLDEEGRRVTGVIIDNTRRMASLIDDLLEFSRLSRATLTPLEVDMTALSGSVLDDLKSAMPVCCRVTVHELPRARGDQRLLREVMANLLANAVKFTGKRSDGAVEVGGERHNGETVYHVKDNGAGFDMKYADKLFGVFQRLHHQDEFPGSGIGLALVQRIVQRHGGRVWAEGRVGEGATFYFALPAQEASHGADG